MVSNCPVRDAGIPTLTLNCSNFSKKSSDWSRQYWFGLAYGCGPLPAPQLLAPAPLLLLV
jgi:hypothetical protein